jgi:ABC-type spermidine/putrescine transport system permease subunit I
MSAPMNAISHRVMAPFWTSQLLRYYTWIMLLGGKGIPAWLAWIGVDNVRLINTPWTVPVGAVYDFLPLMVPPIYASFEKLDKRLLEGSADLGATPIRTFFQVTLPLALPGVATGSMRVFILLTGDYILPQYLGGGKVFFIGNALVDLFLQSRNWPFGAAVSVGAGRNHVRYHLLLYALRARQDRHAAGCVGIAMRIYAILIYIFLYAPIAFIVVGLFNGGKQAMIWQGFSLE